MPGFDVNELMQQAQALQKQMQEAQERLSHKAVTGSAGGGMVVVTANGKGEILRVQIDKQAVDPRDVPMLEDLILAAVNSARRAAEEAQAAEGPLSGLQNLGSLAGMFPGLPK